MPLLSKSEHAPAPKRERRACALDDPDPANRHRAVLARGQDPDAVAEIGARLHLEDDATVRSAIFTALIEIGTPEALDTILPCLSGDDTEMRNAAIEAAQAMPAATAERIEGLLADPDPNLRIFALDILQELAHPAAPDWIAALLARETEENVVGTAIDRLAECGRPEMVEDIRAAAGRFPGSSYIEFACEFACVRLGAPPSPSDQVHHE